MADRPTYVWTGSGWDTIADPGAVRNSLISNKGSLAAGNGSTAVALSVGTNDTVLTADSSTATGLAWKAASSLPSQTSQAGKVLQTNGTAASWVDPPANRNLIINGAMQVAQRSSSVASITGSGYFTADRWCTENSSLGTWTQSVENDAPTGSGFRKSLKMLCTTANASPSSGAYCLMRQLLEGQDVQRIAKGTSDAKPLTLSFWVKSNVTGTFIVEIEDQDNARSISQAYTVASSGTWEKKQIDIPADTTGAFNNDNGASLLVTFWLAAGSFYTGSPLPTTWGARQASKAANGQTNLAAATNNYWQVTGVQLETGPVATPFEFEPYEATLRKCQRYYYLHATGAENAFARISPAYAYTSSQVEGIVQFPTTMRTAPSLNASSGTNIFGFLRDGNVDQFNDFTIESPTTTVAMLRCAANISSTAGHGGAFRIENSATVFVAFSAEL